MNKRLASILVSAAVLSTAPIVSSGEQVTANASGSPPSESSVNEALPTPDQESIYQKGKHSWKFGLVYGQEAIGKNYAEGKGVKLIGASLRRGKMLSSQSKQPSFEFLYGANFSSSNRGYFAGIDAVLAAHFKAQNDSVVVSPSFGFGLQMNDMYKRIDQHAIGQMFVFESTAGLRATFPKLSEKTSYGVSLSHRSYGGVNWAANAGHPNRNHGLNVLSAFMEYRF